MALYVCVCIYHTSWSVSNYQRRKLIHVYNFTATHSHDNARRADYSSGHGPAGPEVAVPPASRCLDHTRYGRVGEVAAQTRR